jgi:hypothetical protein
MSVTFLAVRFIDAQQVDLFSSLSDELIEADLCTDEPLPPFRRYQLIELVTAGWTGGACCRTKRLSPNKALTYVNKLHAGKWISDTEYHRAYCAVNRLLQKCNPVALVSREVSPYFFSLNCDEGATSGPGRCEAPGSSIEAVASPAHTGGCLPDVGNVLSGVRL